MVAGLPTSVVLTPKPESNHLAAGKIQLGSTHGELHTKAALSGGLQGLAFKKCLSRV